MSEVIPKVELDLAKIELVSRDILAMFNDLDVSDGEAIAIVITMAYNISIRAESKAKAYGISDIIHKSVMKNISKSK